MPSQRIPAAPFGGITSRRHAKLLLHLVETGGGGGGASVKDLRLRRVVPPASAHLDSSPDCAAAKPGSVESTPPAPEAAAAEDRERKSMRTRSKLVRDPGSFGYRRLLPFLNEMAKNGASDCSNGEDTAPVANSKEEKLNNRNSSLVDESVGVNHCGADPVDSAESLVLKAESDHGTKDCRDTLLKEEIKIVPVDLTSSKPWLARGARSRIVHHPGSFSYKRMLPFLMENEISSQEGDRIKFRRVSEEEQLASDENGVLTSETSSPEECKGAEDEQIVEQKTSISDDNHVLNCGQLQSAVAEVPPLDGTMPEVQEVAQQVSASDGDPLSSHNGELTSVSNDVLVGGQHQPAVSEDPCEENNVAGVERIVEKNAPTSGENYVHAGSHLQPTVSEVSQSGGTAQQKATQKPVLTSDGSEANRLVSDKGGFLAREQSQPCDTEELLKDDAELSELQQCKSSESGCSDFGFGSPTKTMMVDGCADQQGSLEQHDSLDGLLLDAGMVFRPSDPCDIGTPLSADEMSGCVMHAASGTRKVGTLRPCGAPFLEKQGLFLKHYLPSNGSPCLEKRGLSPKKGILKRHTRGCKGICMCLNCSMFRLHADRAFEFSRKQMQEADDIIGNLLKEVATLRNLREKSSGQEEMEAAWQRVSLVEEVARERRQQMLMELNSHCKIPGPRVKFSQYVEEKIAASPPRSSSSSSRRRR